MASESVAIAVVTGASGGVGSALCGELARRAIHVVALGRDRGRLERCRQQDPARITCLRADLSEPSERERALAELAPHGRIRYLVHAAATIEPVVPAEALREEDWRRAQAINVEAPLFLSLRLAPYLHGGRILHVSSGAAHRPLAGCLTYCATKAALHMIYRALAQELSARDIRVGSASPGSVDTPMQSTLRDAAAQGLDELARFRALAANGQLIPPARSARFLAWLLLESSDALFSQRDWNIHDEALQPLWEVGT